MKILCACRGGTVRSVTLAHILKYELGQDALTVSLEKNTPETLDMVCNWADAIWVVEEPMLEQIPKKYRPKAKLFPIGPDVWLRSLHPELVRRIVQIFDRGEWATFAVKARRALR